MGFYLAIKSRTFHSDMKIMEHGPTLPGKAFCWPPTTARCEDGSFGGRSQSHGSWEVRAPAARPISKCGGEPS